MSRCFGSVVDDTGIRICPRDADEVGRIACPSCDGSGRAGCGQYAGVCERCGGSGEVDRCTDCFGAMEFLWDE